MHVVSTTDYEDIKREIPRTSSVGRAFKGLLANEEIGIHSVGRDGAKIIFSPQLSDEEVIESLSKFSREIHSSSSVLATLSSISRYTHVGTIAEIRLSGSISAQPPYNKQCLVSLKVTLTDPKSSTSTREAEGIWRDTLNIRGLATELQSSQLENQDNQYVAHYDFLLFGTSDWTGAKDYFSELSLEEIAEQIGDSLEVSGRWRRKDVTVTVSEPERRCINDVMERVS